MNVRYPARADMADVLRAARKAGRPTTEEQFVRFAGREGTRVWVAEEGRGNVVGYVLVSDPPGRELVVEALVVDPDYAASGAARDLLDKVLEYNAAAALKGEVAAYVREDDRPGLAMFKALGLPSTLARDHFGQGRDAVRFARSQVSASA